MNTPILSIMDVKTVGLSMQSCVKTTKLRQEFRSRTLPISIWQRTKRSLRSMPILLGLLSIGSMGCGSDTTGPVPLTASQAYWGLRLNYHAVNMAIATPHNTMQLVATPFNAEGTSMSGLGSVSFSTVDSAVSVDSTGFVTAKYVTSGSAAHVIALLQYQNVTLTDTVAIQVTTTAPVAPLATFALQPAASYRTTCDLNASGLPLPSLETCGSLVVTATNTAGDTVANAQHSAIIVAYATSDPLTALINQTTRKITAVDTGHVTFVASTWAYGVAMSDSLRYVINWPQYQNMSIVMTVPPNGRTPIPTFQLPSVTIGVGGTVAWLNYSAPRIDIVFDNPAAIDSGCVYRDCSAAPTTGVGNVPASYLDPASTGFGIGFAARSFPVAGVYHYHSTLYPSSTGVIYVREDITP
jgi:hypothetical protein